MAAKKQEKDIIKTALVVGGAGFVGSYVCESLLAQNICVFALDDLSSGKEEFIEKIKKDKNFKFIHADINSDLDSLDLPPLDYIFHIGGIESYINGHDLTINTMLVNSIGTYKTLELARKYPKSKYLLVSVLDIYDGVLSTLNMTKYYGLSDRDNRKYTHHEAKRYAEALLSEYVNKFDVDGRIVRLADVYGPRMDLESGTDISQMIKETVQGDSITINGDGLKIIRPTYVTDVVAGITKAMFAENTKGKIYNLVSTNEINVLNLAYVIQKNSTKAIKIQFNQNYTEMKFPVHKVELQQTQHDLGWLSKTDISEGITQTLEYYFLKSDAKQTKKSTDEANQVKVENQEQKTKDKNVRYVQNNLTQKVEPITKLNQGSTIPEKNEKKTTNHSNYINIALIAFSLFIILLLFLFPLLSLYFTTGGSFVKTEAAIQEYSEAKNLIQTPESSVEAQKDIIKTLSQYDSLEWFFSMTRQRDTFENARGILNGIDKLNKAIVLATKDNHDSVEILQNIVTGSLFENKTSKLEEQQAQIIRTAEEASISLISENISIPFNSKKDNLINVIHQSSSVISSIKTNVTIKNNVINFLAPQTEKNYMLLLIDSRNPGYEGGTVYGIALARINKNGIQDVTFNQLRATTASTIDQAINQGREFAKSIKISSIDGVILLNTAAQKRIITHLDQVNIKTYAEIVNSKNYNQKIENSQAKVELQYEAWKELWARIREGNPDTLTAIAQGVKDSIMAQNIKTVSVSSEGIYGLPLCEADQTLYNNFVEPLNPIQLDPQAIYCINLSENANTKNDNTKIKRQILTKIQGNSAKLTYEIDNKDTTLYSGILQIMLPQDAKLSNVQVDFPISFDKVRIIRANKYNAYMIDLTVESLEKKEIIIEWSDEAMLSQPLTSFYLSKPFGSTIETNSIEVKGVKNTAAQIKNRDAIATIKN